MCGSSAPGDSLLPLRGNTHGTTPDVRRDVSEVHRDVTNTKALVSDIHNMLRSQEGIGGQLRLVSLARSLSLTEYTLTVA